MKRKLSTTMVATAAAATMFFAGGVSQAAQKGAGTPATEQQQNAPAMNQQHTKDTTTHKTPQNGSGHMASSEDRQEAIATVDAATKVFQGVTDTSGQTIPSAALQNAAGIVIIPEVIKAGLIAGGRHGTGVLLAKNQNEWSLPVFVSITGGSLGAQVGVESSDLILVFNKQENLQEILNGSDFTLGADASAVAGSTGAMAKTSTKDAEILVYTNTKGLFAGASVTGSVITLNEDSTTAFYNLDENTVRGYYGDNEEKLFQGIINENNQMKAGKKLIQTVPQSASNLRDALQQHSSK